MGRRVTTTRTRPPVSHRAVYRIRQMIAYRFESVAAETDRLNRFVSSLESALVQISARHSGTFGPGLNQDRQAAQLCPGLPLDLLEIVRDACPREVQIMN